MQSTFENEQLAYKTTSTLSEWVGPGALTTPEIESPPRHDSQVPFDTFDWTTRLIDMTQLAGDSTGVAIGPTSSVSDKYWHLLLHMRNWAPHKAIMSRFTGFSYDAIKIRVTMSNPKSVAGGLMVGWYPYVDYYDESPVGTFDVWTLNSVQRAALFNSSNAQLMLFGNAQDIVLTIPWSFKFPMFFTNWQLELAEDSQDSRPPYGTPMLYISRLPGTSSVSEFGGNGVVRVFAEFENLRYYAPDSSFDDPATVAQSGAEAVLPALAVGAAVDTGLDFVHEKLLAAMETAEEPTATANPGNYDNPQAVQMSYFGDTTSVSYPQTRPIFKDGLPSPSEVKMPSVHELLSRPQYLGYGTTGSGTVFVRADPMNPLGTSTSKANYFRYLGLLNRYWRGNLQLHIIIAGHPLVEVQIETQITYRPGTQHPPLDTFSTSARNISVVAGCKHLVLTLPFASFRDYFPIIDVEGNLPFNTVAPCAASIDAKVIGTMLDIEPTIPFYLFLSAGPDFKFYQPYPCGFYNPEDNSLRPSKSKQTGLPVIGVKKKDPKTRKQIGLPFSSESEMIVIHTRAAITPDPGTLPAFEHLQDYMKIWSRCLSFDDYANNTDEEPIMDAGVGLTSPCWFPPVDRARDYGALSSWFFTLDYVSYLSILFLYWRGTIGAKITADTDKESDTPYMYVALSGINDVDSRIPTHSPFTSNALPPQANFATGAVVTPVALQPVLEVSVPYRGSNIWGISILNAYGRGVTRNMDDHPAGVVTNVSLANSSKVLQDAMFRKVDSDFTLCLESTLPPPAFWINRGQRVTVS